MFKVIAAWSHPKPEDVEAFEKHYLGIHAPLAGRVPELRRLVLSRTSVGLEGAAPAFHRIAEMAFDDPQALERSAHSPQWKALREDAGVMVGKFGVKPTSASVGRMAPAMAPASISQASIGCCPPRAPCVSASISRAPFRAS